MIAGPSEKRRRGKKGSKVPGRGTLIVEAGGKAVFLNVITSLHMDA